MQDWLLILVYAAGDLIPLGPPEASGAPPAGAVLVGLVLNLMSWALVVLFIRSLVSGGRSAAGSSAAGSYSRGAAAGVSVGSIFVGIYNLFVVVFNLFVVTVSVLSICAMCAEGGGSRRRY